MFCEAKSEPLWWGEDFPPCFVKVLSLCSCSSITLFLLYMIWGLGAIWNSSVSGIYTEKFVPKNPFSTPNIPFQEYFHTKSIYAEKTLLWNPFFQKRGILFCKFFSIDTLRTFFCSKTGLREQKRIPKQKFFCIELKQIFLAIMQLSYSISSYIFHF